VGTTVEFVNEDVFDLLDGERTGRHDAVVIDVRGPEPFVTPKLGHGDRYRITFTQPGEYTYICSIHPYMKGVIRVYAPVEPGRRAGTGASPLNRGEVPGETEAPGDLPLDPGHGNRDSGVSI